MILLLILLVPLERIAAQTVHDVLLKPGQPYEILTPNYPELLEWGKEIKIEWNLKVENNGKMKILCSDVRMIQMQPWDPAACKSVYFSITDGDKESKHCNRGIYDFLYKSSGSQLTLKVVTTNEGSALLKCVAISLADPEPEEIIELHPNGNARKLKITGTHPNLDRLWVFNSPEGTRMSFQCSIHMRPREPVCGWNAVTFNNGKVDEEVCENRDFLWFSKENHAKLRIQLDNTGYGHIDCLAQAVTGPHPNEYENAVSEEVDSSEHGVTPGRKKPSCECGWSNKGVARIINGNETRANEFPWMVHLYVGHETPRGPTGTTCGASIITARHVLTAAHCVFLFELAKPENIEMELAKHDSNKPTGKEIKIGAERLFVRERFLKEGLYSHDIAIILTKERINFSPIVGPVCIEPNAYPIINKNLIIMGWGLTEDGSSSSYLRKGKSVVIDPILCGASGWDVCTTNVPNSFCSGDSGGPLVRLDQETNRYVQKSLVSRGSSCFGGTQISTYVAFFYDWIQEIIKETDPSVQTCY
uniref:Venom s1 protease 13 n=1 Tax=Pristhesancus plagipennis TaxID=1955184 RepID=A0A1Q1NPF0_PRIPG|nr:venom s1 protease 13 [Pristhesancus plagipennis]